MYYTGMVSAAYHTTFLSKPLILNANVATNGWEKGLEKVQGTFAAMMALRTTERSYLGVGLYGMTHYNRIPVMPILIYMNQLYPDVSLDITFPSYLFLRYQFCGNQRVSIGATLENRNFYLNPEREDLPKISYFSEACIKPELIYEYIINQRLYLKARTGMSAIVQSGIFNTNYKGIDWDPYLDFSRKMSSYFSVGISYNLF